MVKPVTPRPLTWQISHKLILVVMQFLPGTFIYLHTVFLSELHLGFSIDVHCLWGTSFKFNVAQRGPQTYCSSHLLNRTVVSLFNQALPLLFTASLPRLPQNLTNFLKDLPSTLNTFLDCFLLTNMLISLKSAFYFILQAGILSQLWHCLPFSSVWQAASCSAQTCTSRYSVEIFNHLPNTTWLDCYNFNFWFS